MTCPFSQVRHGKKFGKKKTIKGFTTPENEGCFGRNTICSVAATNVCIVMEDEGLLWQFLSLSDAELCL